MHLGSLSLVDLLPDLDYFLMEIVAPRLDLSLLLIVMLSHHIASGRLRGTLWRERSSCDASVEE